MSSEPPAASNWKRGVTRLLASTRVLELHGVVYSHPVRKTDREFTVIHTHDWVNVVAITPDRRMVLVRQFRYGIGQMSIEIPGGVMEDGEDAVTAGLRELKEETGYSGSATRLLGSVHPNPAIQDNRCHLVLVENAVKKDGVKWDDDEELDVIVLPVDEVYALAHAGEITHALALNGLLKFGPLWAEMKGRPV